MRSASSPTISVARRYWRMLAPKWAHAPLSGAGAAVRGGRYNQVARPALYMSEDFVTAIAEYEQDLGIRPGTLCAYEVESDRIVDLTDLHTRTALGFDDVALHAQWKQLVFIEKREPPGWPLAERLIAEGAHGLRAPSIQTNGFNLILWRWNTDGGARVSALDPLRDLPSNQSSWR